MRAEKAYKIVDCHCHVYPDKIAQKASDSISKFYNLPVRLDGRAQTIKRLAREAGITKSIIFSVATKPSQTRSINEFIASEAAECGDMFAGLGTLHPDSDDLEGDMRRLLDLGLRGVKLHPDIQGFKLDDYRCLKIYEICEREGVPVLLHTGDSRFDNSNPNRLKPLLEIFTDLKFIGAHLGGYSVWESACEMLSGHDNFYADCSSSLYALTPEDALRIIRSYGADKVMFGTDFPMWEPAGELERLFKLDLSEDELEQILWKNANKMFKLGMDKDQLGKPAQ